MYELSGQVPDTVIGVLVKIAPSVGLVITAPSVSGGAGTFAVTPYEAAAAWSVQPAINTPATKRHMTDAG
jgi:hypothetical protein